MPTTPHCRWVLPCAAAAMAMFHLTTAWAQSLQPAIDASGPLTLDGPLDLSTPMPWRTGHLPAGSSKRTDNGRLASKGWSAKIDIEKRQPAVPWRVEPVSPVTDPGPADGAARAKVSAPGFDSPLSWDEVSIETRVDPLQEQGQLGTRLRRSVPVGGNLAMTVEGGYSMTQPLALLPASTTTPAATPVWGSEQRLRLSVLPSNTTITLDSTVTTATADHRWLRSLSAEQRLFGGPVTVSGSVSETAAGNISRTLKAGFTKVW